MARFFLGLILGGLSASATYACTGDGHGSAIIGAISCVLTWCGLLTFVLGDD